MSDSSPSNPEQEECKKERDSAYDTLNNDQAEYDKQILALSAAFLGVALAFVKDVVPLKDAAHLWMFDAALGSFLASVCLVLWTFQYSIHGHFRLADYWELREKSLSASEAEKSTLDSELNGRWTWLDQRAKKIRLWNICSGVLFGVGTILLVLFVTTNVHREARLASISAQDKTAVSSDKTDKPGAGRESNCTVNNSISVR